MKCSILWGVVAVTALAGAAQGQTTITQWNFNSLPTGINNAPTPSTGQGKAVPLGMTNNYTYNIGSPPQVGSVVACDINSAGVSTDGGNCWRVRGKIPATGVAGIGWSIFAPQLTQGAEFDVSTVNYGNIQFTFDWFTTNQGINNMQVQYSLDGGTTWSNIGGILGGLTSTHNNAWLNAINVDFSGVAGASDNPKFRVRLMSVYDPNYTGPGAPTYTGASGGQYNNSSGNWRFDSVTVTGDPIRSIGPSILAAVNSPAVCAAGGTLTFTAAVESGALPPSTSLSVKADLSPFGLSPTQAMFDNGTNGDAVAGDGVYTYTATVPAGQTLGAKTINATVTDNVSRSSTVGVAVSVGDCSQSSPASVVISQTFGAGGKLGDTAAEDSPYNADFVELYNRSASTVSLNGWSVQYADAGSPTGFDDPTNRVNLSGSIQPGQRVLVRMGDPVAGFSALPTPDFAQLPALGGMSDTGGRVALVRSTTLIGSNFNSPSVEDLVGYGTAVNFEGSGPAPVLVPTSNKAEIRKANGAQDTNQNFNDFSSGSPNPRNRASGGFLAGYPSTDVAAVCSGSTVIFKVNVSPASGSTNIQVSADVSAITGSPSTVQLFDNGTNGDVAAGDNIFTLAYTVPAGAAQGVRTVSFSVQDLQAHTDASSVSVSIGNCGESFAPVVISQIYPGGGNTGSAYYADYVEIFNRSLHAVSLEGWSLQSARISEAGFDSRRGLLNGSIAPGEYKLFVVASPTSNGAVLPSSDFTPNPPFNMESNFGRVCLVSTSNFVHADYDRADVVDLVGYGSQSQSYLGVAPVATTNDFVVAVRKQNGCQDTRQNSIDFDVVQALSLPHNSQSPFNVCPARTCPADLNGDNVVDDSDFVIFAQAYNTLDCADQAMPIGCWADLNSDNSVDDTDFVQFAAAYNDLLCP